MKLYLIRHGESETNLAKVYTGWSQVLLTETGKQQARALQPRLAAIPFDKVYSSDLIRAMQTAALAYPAMEAETTPLLREFDVGSLAGRAGGSVRIVNRDFTPFGGENREMINARARAFLDLLESDPKETVAAFSHAGYLRAMLGIVMESELPQDTFLCPNCTVAIFEYDGKKWRLHSWNAAAL